MEAVRTIEGVRLPVLTPNLKVNFFFFFEGTLR